MNTKDNLKREIAYLLDLNTDQIYSQIGFELAGETFHATELTDAEKKKRGIAWWNHSSDRLTEHICNSHLIALMKEEPGKWDTVFIVAAIADLIASAVVNVSPITCAVLIMKRGILKLC